MNNAVSDQPVSAPPENPTSAGAQLRTLREAAQLTVDDVAHQLKLARRQVIAIENDDFDALPGPTFVRGFIRNYARLLRVDADPLLHAGNLISPNTAPIQQIAPTMGELPVDTGSGPGWTRWVIPSALALVLIAGIAYYELTVAPGSGKKARKEAPEAVVAPPTTASEPIIQPATTPATEPSGSAPAEPAASTTQAAPAAQARQPVSLMQASSGSQASPATQAVAADTGRLDLEFAGPSWVEVRDARGEILLSRTMSAGERQTLTGKLPLALRLGNASVARLQFDGKPVDLAPHTRAEIARLNLPLQRP